MGSDMSFADERQAIEARISTNWTITPVQYENVSFTKPNDNEYVSLVILPGAASQIDMADSPMHRHIGVITMQVFGPADAGTNTARTQADGLAAIFRNAQFTAGSSGTILCRSPEISRVGVVNGIFQLNVSVPYQRDVTFS